MSDGNKSLIHVPGSAAEFRPTKPMDLSVVAKSFLRDHFAELRPYLLSMAGEADTMTGHPRMDEAAMTFKAQEIAGNNGYSILANLLANDFRLVLRRAYRSHTGTSVGALMDQGNHLRIEHKKAK